MIAREDLYRYVKIGGLASFIPFVLVSGPIVGYVAGSYLRERFGFNNIVVIVMTSIGLVFSIGETIKILKKLTRLEPKNSDSRKTDGPGANSRT